MNDIELRITSNQPGDVPIYCRVGSFIAANGLDAGFTQDEHDDIRAAPVGRWWLFGGGAAPLIRVTKVRKGQHASIIVINVTEEDIALGCYEHSGRPRSLACPLARAAARRYPGFSVDSHYSAKSYGWGAGRDVLLSSQCARFVIRADTNRHEKLRPGVYVGRRVSVP